MAGETQKTSALTNAQNGIKSYGNRANGRIGGGQDHHQFAAATELEAADVLITIIEIPSNAIMRDIEIINDDMDTDGSAALTLDVGVCAVNKHVSVTSGTATTHLEDAVVDADLFVDADTNARTATAEWTKLVIDTGTQGPEDAAKPIWEMLGYDFDPNTVYRLCVTSAAASVALASAADFGIRCDYYTY